jgi:hypothetical protein
VAYHSNRMSHTRRSALASIFGSTLLAAGTQETQQPEERRLPIPDTDTDRKLPNGKSQKDAIAQDQHERSLKEAEELITLAQQLKDELQKAGNYVVPLATVKKTEEIEKLARRIRSRLKG